MPSGISQGRVWLTAALLIVAMALLHGVSHGERVSTRRPLRDVPLALGAWQGRDAPMEARIVEATGADDYVRRVYLGSDGRPLDLYVGYYGSQRTGDTIHSPKNCLPGAGWEPVRNGRLEIQMTGGAAIRVNEYQVQKGLDRQLVLYWYHARGRVEASEYWAKVWMVLDAVRRNRTDGALVRVVIPIQRGEKDAEDAARASAVSFVRSFFPHLSEFVPD